MIWLSVIIVLTAGAMLPMQAGVNAQLARSGGHALWATGASFFVGTLALLIVYTGLRHPWPGIMQLKEAPLLGLDRRFNGCFFCHQHGFFCPQAWGNNTTGISHRRTDERLSGFRSFWGPGL